MSHTDNWIWLLLWQNHQSVNRKTHLSYRCYQKKISFSIWKVIPTKKVLLFLEDKLHDFLNWLLMCKKAFYLRELWRKKGAEIGIPIIKKNPSNSKYRTFGILLFSYWTWRLVWTISDILMGANSQRDQSWRSGNGNTFY